MAKIERTVKLNVETQEAIANMDKLGTSFEDVFGEVRPMMTQIGEMEDALYEMAAAGQQGSKAFNDLASKIADMKTVVLETDMQIDAMTGSMAGTVAGAAQGVASGFELAQGAMAAFGVESEAVEETLLKVQSAMAISQGLQGIKESIGSFKALGIAIAKTKAGQVALNAATKVYSAVTKGMTAVQWAFNAALNANPIGAIVVAITALIAAGYALIKLFSWFTEDTISAAEANEQLNKSIEKQNRLFEDNANAIRKNAENRRRLLEVNGASEEALHQDTLNRLKEEETLRKDQMKNLEANIADRRKLYKQALEEEDSETAQAIKDEIAADREKYKELALNNQEYNIAVQEENARFREQEQKELDKQAQDEKNRQKEALARWKTYQANRLSALRTSQDIELGLMQEGLDKELKANEIAFNRIIEDVKKNENLKENEKRKLISLYDIQRQMKEDDIRKKYLQAEKAKLAEQQAQEEAAREQWAAQEEEFYTQYYESTTNPHQLELDAVNDKYFQMIEMAKQYGLDTKILEEQQAAEIKAINDAKRQQELADEQALQDAKFDLASSSLSAVSDLVGAFAGENEKQQKKAFQIQKAISIAQAVMETYKGANAIFASAAANPATVLFPAQPFIAAGAAIVSGLANVATIAKTQFQGGGGSGGGGGASSPPSLSGGGSPSFNIVGNSGTNQLAESLSERQPVKAYVVPGEVTTGQALDRNKIEQSTI